MGGKVISTTESTLPNSSETCVLSALPILCFGHLQKELEKDSSSFCPFCSWGD